VPHRRVARSIRGAVLCAVAAVLVTIVGVTGAHASPHGHGGSGLSLSPDSGQPGDGIVATFTTSAGGGIGGCTDTVTFTFTSQGGSESLGSAQEQPSQGGNQCEAQLPFNVPQSAPAGPAEVSAQESSGSGQAQQAFTVTGDNTPSQTTTTTTASTPPSTPASSSPTPSQTSTTATPTGTATSSGTPWTTPPFTPSSQKPVVQVQQSITDVGSVPKGATSPRVIFAAFGGFVIVCAAALLGFHVTNSANNRRGGGGGGGRRRG
jgi:hypothetical protein